MLLKQLKMHNFRQYKGTQLIEFSVNPDKNVTVILGDNTYGKTTLLQAFNWCFYGSVNFDNPDSLLNYDIEYSMDDGAVEEVLIEIILIHSGIEYVVTRSENFSMRKGKLERAGNVCRVSYLSDDGQMKPVKQAQVQKFIESILPQDLSTYFFFDTERVKSVNERKDLAESVKGLLGLTVLDNALKHIGTKSKRNTVLGRFYSAIDSAGDRNAQEALRLIQDAQERKELSAKRLEENKDQLEQYEVRKEQLEGILRSNFTTSQLQKKKEDFEKSISREQVTYDENVNLIIKEFGKKSTHFFAQPLIKRAQDFLSATEIDDKGIKDLTRITLEDIIARGKCVCGRSITDGSDAYEHIMHEMNFVPPESLGNSVRTYKERLGSYSFTSDLTYQSIEARYKTLLSTKGRIQEWGDEIEDISRTISGKENMSRYETELVDVKKRLKDLSGRKEQLIRDEQTQIDNITKYQKIYDGTAAASDKNKAVMQNIRYAEYIYHWLDLTYKDSEDSIRHKLEEVVNSIFKRMYHGQRRVSIDSKYQVSLLTTIATDLEIETGESEGLNRVKNFAFIAGLVQLAKERIVSDAGGSEFDLSSEPYPLVMDAPFSNADEKHIRNISEVLPEVAEQVIMFVMKKDWQYAEPVINEKVGSQYKLVKHNERFSELMKGI